MLNFAVQMNVSEIFCNQEALRVSWSLESVRVITNSSQEFEVEVRVLKIRICFSVVKIATTIKSKAIF